MPQQARDPIKTFRFRVLGVPFKGVYEGLMEVLALRGFRVYGLPGPCKHLLS